MYSCVHWDILCTHGRSGQNLIVFRRKLQASSGPAAACDQAHPSFYHPSVIRLRVEKIGRPSCGYFSFDWRSFLVDCWVILACLSRISADLRPIFVATSFWHRAAEQQHATKRILWFTTLR
jgi:hypothetical protein